MPDVEVLAIVFISIGAFAQAITGIGFALVGGPLMVLCLGPHQGVIVIGAFGIILSSLVLIRERKHVEVRHAVLLLAPACAVMPIGAIIAKHASANTLSITIGTMVLAAVGLLASGFRWKHLKGLSGAAISGTISGLMGYLGGVTGPAVAMYAINSEWSPTTLRPTTNAYFLGISVVFLFVRGTPSVSLGFGIGLATSVLIGFGCGGLLTKRLNHDAVRRLILVLAAFGGLATIAKGVL